MPLPEGMDLARPYVLAMLLLGGPALAQAPGLNAVRVQGSSELSLDGNGRWLPLAQADRVGDGSEVVIPANTFIATAEAVVRAGGTPVPPATARPPRSAAEAEARAEAEAQARFAARYAPLGFTVAAETLALMLARRRAARS